MVNAKYMKVLARLESAACTQKEKDAINMVRGRYVQQFGTDNAYVNALGKLEAVAATKKEKDDVNMIRGKYGLFEMTYGADVDDDTDLEYENDIYTPEGEGGDQADRMMDEEDRLFNQYGTHMNVVGDEVVRSLDKNVRDEEDAEEEEDRLDEKYEQSVTDSDRRFVERAVSEVRQMLKDNGHSQEYQQVAFDNFIYRLKNDARHMYDRVDDGLRRDKRNAKYFSPEIWPYFNQVDLQQFNDALVLATESQIKNGQLNVVTKSIVKAPNGINVIKPSKHAINFKYISLDDNDSDVLISLNIHDFLTNVATINYYRNEYYTNIKVTVNLSGTTFEFNPRMLRMYTYNFGSLPYEHNFIEINKAKLYTIMRKCPKFIKYLNQALSKVTSKESQVSSHKESIIPERTREDAYTDFDESHPDLDEVDPYSKYESVNKKDKRGLTEGVAYDEHGTLVDDDVEVPEIEDTSTEDDLEPTNDAREKMCRRIAKDTGYPLDAVREVCWMVLHDKMFNSVDKAKRYGNFLHNYYADRQVEKSLD